MDIDAFGPSSPGKLVPIPSGHWAFVPNPLPPSLAWTSDLVAALSEADRALGELAGLGRTLLNPHVLIMPFVRREAVLSSRIEGTQASLTDLYAYEAVQLTLFRSPPDVQEVYNYVRALEHGLRRLTELPLSLRLIREIHSELMAGVRGEEKRSGHFRDVQNYIAPPGYSLEQATYVPPPVSEMHQALDALEKYIHGEPSLPPLVRLGLIHYQFEAIHPFVDGNGRIGRLLITLQLCAENLLPEPLLYLSAYFEAHRQAYYDRLLAVSREGDWNGWLRFFLVGVADQARDAVARARRLQDLRERYREQLQTERAAGRLLQAVDVLFGQPMLTMPQLADALGVNHAMATRYIRRLEETAILHEITGQARNRVYQAQEVLAAIEDPLEKAGGLPPREIRSGPKGAVKG